jgi:hypothetical protein
MERSTCEDRYLGLPGPSSGVRLGRYRDAVVIAQRLRLERSRPDPGAMDVRTVLGDRTERFDESLHTIVQQAACPIAARPAS